MNKRIILGGLVGAVLVFVVSSIWHLAGNLGEIGIKNMPGGGAVETAMRASIHDPGFYFFPPAPPMSGQPKEQAAAAQTAYLEAYKQGPTGILIYSPGGTELQFAKLLLNQFSMNVVAGLLIAWILGIAAGSTTFGSRVLIVLLISIIAGVIYDLPYWNWYGFPMNYTIAHISSWVISWGVAGLGMAAIVKR
jgi:hypothetical protein